MAVVSCRGTLPWHPVVVLWSDAVARNAFFQVFGSFLGGDPSAPAKYFFRFKRLKDNGFLFDLKPRGILSWSNFRHDDSSGFRAQDGHAICAAFLPEDAQNLHSGFAKHFRPAEGVMMHGKGWPVSALS